MTETSKDIATAHPEVEFALVLARTIDAVRNDPEQLRGAIYELARQKLQEQFVSDDPEENRLLLGALEVAIQGVEAHSRKIAGIQLFPAATISGPVQSRRMAGALEGRQQALTASDDVPRLEREGLIGTSARAAASPKPNADRSLRKRLGAPLRFLVLLLVIGVVALVIPRRTEIAAAGRQLMARASAPAAPQPVPVAAAPPPAVLPPTALPPGIPTAYGIYAVNAGKLYELEPLLGRVPDGRVAISAAITKPSAVLVPDGHVKFVVYRRDSASSAPDQVEVRLIAKVVQATTFDATGKPVTAPAEDSWVIRNVSFPYRTAPIRDNAEMFEVQPRDPDSGLSPGRYGLVVKGQAYDFTVEGPVTDKRQCLERLVAANGVFFSECQKQSSP
ncbi:hypothetical protein FIU28_16755 [Tardiphaga sp. vice154]|nr:hypothetical protein FIU28_16755 [Tardiphaga sp. vice154]